MPLCRRSVAATGLALAACTASPSPAPPRVAPALSPNETISIRVSEGTALSFDLAADGRVVFDLLGQIWEADGRGGAARALTDAVRDTAEDLDPSLAPDGSRIVFRGERRGRTGLWLHERGGGSPRQLTQLINPDGFDGSAAWSPDGRTIAFSRVAPGDADVTEWASSIVLLELDGNSERTLRIDGLPSPRVRDPAWHPGGERIAFVEALPRVERGGRVWIVDREGGRATPITPEGTEAFAPVFAPDGRRIAYFAHDSAGLVQVWVRNGEGRGDPIRITSHADVSPTRIRWSADGGRVAYAADGRLWEVAATGGAPGAIGFTAELTFQRPRLDLPQAQIPQAGRMQPAHAFAGLALSPDARRVAMIALGKLWVMPVTGRPRAVADVPASARYLTWRSEDRVAWSAGRFGEEDIFATDLESGATHRVTALRGREVYPAYSPDGRQLAFVHAVGEGAAHLRVADARSRELADLSRTTLLDSIELGWTASNADVPVWSPESDALLRTAGGWSPGSPTEGIVTSLKGESRRMAGFPDSPLYLQWTRNGVVFVRHARLWKAPIDAMTLDSARPLGAGPAMYVSAAADGTLLYISDGGLRLRSPDGGEQALGWPLSFTPPAPKPLLIRGARIIDGTGSPPSPPSDILVDSGRIVAIAPVGAFDSRMPKASSESILDATGKFVVPGFFDLHAHVYRPDLLPAFLYFGVTTMRDQGASLGPLVASAEAIAAGAFDGPRLAYGGFQLYTDWAWDTEDGLGVEPEVDAGHAQRTVELAALFGAQHVKTRTFRRWDINARLVAEAHRRGMRATGHCAHPLPLIASGMDAQEHLGFCPPRGGGLVYDDIVQLYRAARVAVVPTLAYTDFAARLERPGLLEEDRELAPLLPERSSFGWMLGMDSARRAEMARLASRARQSALRLGRGGVTIGTGTDIWQLPTGVHEEMELMVTAGFTPLEAIRAATANAARIVGVDQDLGTVSVGKVADLIVLDRDPSGDIGNTRRISSVIQGGRLVDRRALRRMVE